MVVFREHTQQFTYGKNNNITSIFDVNDVERARVLFDVLHETDTTQIATADNHAEVARLEFDELDDFASFDVDLDGVVDFDERVRVADGARVVRDNVRHAFGADELVAHAAQLVLGFLRQNFQHRETAFDVVEQAKVFVGFRDLHNVHEAAREGGVGANFAVDFHQALHENLCALTTSQCVSITQEWKRIFF